MKSKEEILTFYNKLSCRNGVKVIFDSISFDIQLNRILAVVGPSGGGKSTILNVLSGNLSDQITCEFESDFPFGSPEIAHFTQFPDNRTSSFYKLFKKNELDILKCIKQFWLDEGKASLMEYYHKTSIEILPRQVRKMFELMFFMMSNTSKSVWLMDEPEVDMIGDGQHDTLVELIKNWGKGKTIVIVTHNVEFTGKIADDILYIHFGKVIEQSAKEVFFNSENPDVQYLINMGC